MESPNQLDTASKTITARPTAEQVSAELAASTLRSLPTAALTLSVMYALLAVAHFAMLPPEQRIILAPLAGATALILLVFYVALRQDVIDVAFAQLGAGLCGFAALINSAVHLWVSNDPLQATNLILVMVTIGAFFLSSRWFWILTIAAIASWIAVQATRPFDNVAIHFAIAMIMSFIAAVLINRIRMKAYSNLHSLRLQHVQQQKILETYQQSLETRVEARTAELAQTNASLQEEAVRRSEIEKALKLSQQSLMKERATLERQVAEQTIELRSANLALKETADMKSSFMAEISHDIQEPLFSLISKIEVMQQGLAGAVSERQSEMLGELLTNADQIGSVIGSMRNASRMDGAGIKEMKSSINAQRLIESVATSVRTKAKSSNVSVETYLDANVSLINSDSSSSQLKHILSTLMNNAVAATSASHTVGIAVKGQPTRQELKLVIWRSEQISSAHDELLTRGVGVSEQLLKRANGRIERFDGADGLLYSIHLPWKQLAAVGTSAELHAAQLPASLPAPVRTALRAMPVAQ